MQGYEETIELIKKARNGDEKALETLTVKNSPLVKSIVKRYLKKYVEYEDLFQLGSIGLVKAIKNFDTSFNVRFSTYAVPLIAGEIKRFLRDDGSIKVSRSVKQLSSEIKSFIDEYKNKHETSPEISVIAEKFNLPESEIIFALDASRMPVSIYKKLNGSGDKQVLMEKISGGDESESLIMKLALKSALKNLDEREKKIVLLRFYRGKTQSEVAEILNVSQVQVSRIENTVLKKLKRELAV